jgi:hypothetical protein
LSGGVSLRASPDGFHALAAMSTDRLDSLLRLPAPAADLNLNNGIIDTNR